MHCRLIQITDILLCMYMNASLLIHYYSMLSIAERLDSFDSYRSGYKLARITSKCKMSQYCMIFKWSQAHIFSTAPSVCPLTLALNSVCISFSFHWKPLSLPEELLFIRIYLKAFRTPHIPQPIPTTMARSANNTFWGEKLQLWKKMKWLGKRQPWHREAYTVISLIILFMVQQLAVYTVPNTMISSLRHFPGAISTGTKPNLSVCGGFIVFFPLIPDLSEYNYIRYALNRKKQLSE